MRDPDYTRPDDGAFEIVGGYGSGPGDTITPVWFVTHHGYQLGGKVDASGAGDRTFASVADARAFLEACKRDGY